LREYRQLSRDSLSVARTAATAAVPTAAAATTTVAATAAAAVPTATAATTTVAATTATAAATTTTTESATAAGSAAAAKAAATGGLGDRLVDAQIATANGAAVQCTNCGLSLFICAHLDKAETLRTTAFAIHDDLCGYNATVFRT
jgi:hypothetical protein